MLFRGRIPPGALDAPAYREMVSARLEAKARIHPELVYYQVELLRNLFGGPGAVSGADFAGYAYGRELAVLSRRNAWARGQIAALEASAAGDAAKKAGRAYLEALIVEDAPEPAPRGELLALDPNLRDYFVSISIARGAPEAYDPATDYGARRRGIERSILDRYERAFEETRTAGGVIGEEILEDLADHWYVYEDLADGLAGRREAHEVIGRVLEHNYASARSPRFTLRAGYCFHTEPRTLTVTLPVRYTTYSSYSDQPRDYADPAIDLRYRAKQWIASVEYRIPVRDEVGILSHVSLQVAAALSAGEAEENRTTATDWSGSGGGFDIAVSEDLEQRSTLRGLDSYTVRAGIPFVAIGRSLFLETSLNCGLLRVNSTTEYRYAMRTTEGFITGPIGSGYYYTHLIARGDGTGTVDHSRNYFIAYPTIDLFFETDGGAQLSASINHRYFALACGYRF